MLLIRLIVLLAGVISTILSDPSRPNIVIIIADDLGWADVGFHSDCPFIVTPNIDILAKEGIILNNYYVSPICSPSRGSLLTGYDAVKIGLQHDVIQGTEPWGLPENFTILPQYFKSLGYHTHLVGKWHQGFYRESLMPTNRGFDTFLGYVSGATDYYDRISRYQNLWGQDWYSNLEPIAKDSKPGLYSTDVFVSRAEEIIQFESESNSSFLLILSLQAVHIANSEKRFQVPKEYQDVFESVQDENLRKYFGMLNSLDDAVGRVVRRLYEAGQANNTVIVFTTDNGAPTGTLTNSGINLGVGSNEPLRGSKYTLFEGGIRGVAWIWANFLKNKGTIYQGLSHISDILPTLYEAAGGRETDLPPFDGWSIWSAIQGDTGHELRHEIVHNIDDFWKVAAIRQGDFKMIVGTVFDGEFDNWVTRTVEWNNMSKIFIEFKTQSSEIGGILGELDPSFGDRKSQKIRINCVQVDTNFRPCFPAEAPCLFNIKWDPCEYNNIASEHPEIIEKLQNELNYIRARSMEPVNKPPDDRGNPVLHDYYWTWWK